LVFGFDGATWQVLDELIAAGRMPNLTALAARGRTFDLETIRPTFSPIIWTSIATGKTRFQHGIHDVVQSELPGGVVLPRSIERTAFLTKTAGVVLRLLDRQHLLRLSSYRSSQIRATSVFEAASEAGLPATEIEWYVSWPARQLSGINVSDRFHLQAPDMEQLPGAVSPDSANAELRRWVVTPEQVPVQDILALADMEALPEDQQLRWADSRRAFVEEMRINLARDLTTRNVAVDLLRRMPDWRLFGVYFRAVDVSHHLTWKYRNAEGGPGELAANPDLRLRTVVDRYHEFMDRVVGDLLAAVPADAVILILSDHGFEDRYGHSRGPTGFAIAAGDPIIPSSGRGKIGVYEIAPTIAFLLGLPPADDLEAAPRTDVFDPLFVAAHSTPSIPTWEREGRWAGEEDFAGAGQGILDQEEIERLRAIGYIR
jgi:arylsulfatase A-like enzyme